MADEYFQFIDDPQELEQFHQFTTQIFLEEKHYNLVSPDAYTKHARHYVIKEQDQIIAAYRMVLGDTMRDFPASHFIELPQDDAHKYAELSRWTIHPLYRQKLVMNRIFADFTSRGLAHGISYFIAKVDITMVKFYERYGLQAWGEAFYDPNTLQKLNPNCRLMIASVTEWQNRYLFKPQHIA